MAYSVKASNLPDGDLHAHKVVIVTGPSLSSGLKLIVFGAVLGAGAALYWKNSQESKLSAPTGAESADSKARLRQLAERAKLLVSRATETIQSAAEMAAPALQNALKEAKQAARDAEAEIEEEIRELKEHDERLEQV